MFPETSYQTAPLADYARVLYTRAAGLFQAVEECVGPRARQYKGSYSVFAASSVATAAKIVIYEAGKGKINGLDPQLADGVYVLIRLHGGQGRTLGIAPKHHERFAYFRLHEGQSLEEVGEFIAAYASSQ